MKTRGGGHSVQFTDIEVLKHNHPSTRERPRPQTPRERPRRSTRLLAVKQKPYLQSNTGTNDEHPNSSLSDLSASGGSSAESSVDEQWTDIETRVCCSCRYITVWWKFFCGVKKFS